MKKFERRLDEYRTDSYKDLILLLKEADLGEDLYPALITIWDELLKICKSTNLPLYTIFINNVNFHSFAKENNILFESLVDFYFFLFKSHKYRKK